MFLLIASGTNKKLVLKSNVICKFQNLKINNATK